jgi:glycosyltransferase involved in cell wall biosynthesis
LVVTQYFWPEHFRVNDLVIALQERGHDVTVLTGRPNYPSGEIYPEFYEDEQAFEQFHGIPVYRVPNAPRHHGSLWLTWNYLSFVLQGVWHGPRLVRDLQPAVIFVFQTSPITSCLPALWIGWRKRAPVVLWTLDLWPDTLSAVGAVRNRAVLGMVGALVRFIYRRCALVLGQSQSFAANVAHYGGGRVSFGYFPQWVETSPPTNPLTPEIAPELDAPPGTFTIVFTGNFGEAQDLGTVLDAATRLRHRTDIRWVLVGTGRAEPALRERIAREGLSACISMPGAFPPSRMASFYRGAGALLASLRAEPALASVLPGKVQSYLAAGRPILAMLDGEGARVIRESRAGRCVPPGDSVALADAALELASLPPEERNAMGRRGIEYAIEHFGRERVIDGLEARLREVAEKAMRR